MLAACEHTMILRLRQFITIHAVQWQTPTINGPIPVRSGNLKHGNTVVHIPSSWQPVNIPS